MRDEEEIRAYIKGLEFDLKLAKGRMGIATRSVNEDESQINLLRWVLGDK